MDYDAGEVYVNPNKRLGLISQIPNFPAGFTVEDVLRSAYADLMRFRQKMELLECQMAKGATEEQLRAQDLLSFRLNSLDFDVEGSNVIVEAPSVSIRDEVGMYTYYKLVFDGVDLSKNSAGDWTRLEVFVKGQKGADPYGMVLVYDRTEEFYRIKDYSLSGGEAPI
jgi:hypothetical protein